MALAVRAFDLSQVCLLDGPIKARQERTRRYLLELDADRLLHTFRVNAGLASSATPLGGWEAPTCGLRGHFVGHYLSACALMYRATGDEALRERATLMVGELGKCQDALRDGYLSAFASSDLDVIETTFDGAWAPYYTLHKILAGLVDVHRYCGDALALQMAATLADYVQQRIAKLPPQQFDQMCRTDMRPNPSNEFGGLSEVLQDLYTFTGKPAHLELAQAWDRDWFLDPLMRREDRLTGLHCNTHIPIVLGAARRYERTGDLRYRDAVTYFWEQTALARSYVNGGSSGPHPQGIEKSKGAEHWFHPHQLANTLTPKINESCVTHNMMRLTDALFQWTGEPRYVDFYERAYFNSVLCMQHPGYLGGYIYDHPLGSCSHKTFGHADDTFWCCYGTTVEAYARLAHGIYYHNEDALWVNMPIASELTWPQKGLRLTQCTDFPNEPVTRLALQCASPVQLTIHIRIPSWATGATLSLNGRPLTVPAATPGSVASINRVWASGDVIELHLPMHLHTQAMPDDPHMIAFLHGPLVLAAQSDQDLSLIASDASSALSRIEPMMHQPPTFRTRLANGSDITLVPLNQIVDERFGVYFRLQLHE